MFLPKTTESQTSANLAGAGTPGSGQLLERQAGMTPLEGLKVLDMTTFLAAPTALRIMGEWGADVIKIEQPKGDPCRTQGAVFNTPYTDAENIGFDFANINKRFITLDLRVPEGREVMDRLLAEADVFLTSTRVKSLVKLGYDYETLHAKFPRLVMAQVLGFGEKGPLKDAAGFDVTAYMSRGGVYHTLLNRGSSPMIPTNGFGDFQIASTILAGVLGALYARERTGEGDYVTTSLFACGVWAINTGMVSAQYGNQYPKDRREVINPFNNTYFAGDGALMTMCAPEYDRDYNKIMALVGREDLVDDERYSICDHVNETQANGDVVDILDAAFSTQPIGYWLDKLREADVPVEKCQLPTDIYEDEQAWANDIIRTIHYPATGNDRIIPTNPIRFRSQGDPELRLSKSQGADTREVLTEIGYNEAEIEAVLASGGAQDKVVRG